MTIFALFLLMIIFAASGFAVDVMRYDRERAKLQYALDRAVLAAADLDQDLCPKDVVVDYLEKEGLDQYLVGEPVVTPNVCGSTAVTIEGYRRVEASAQMDVGMHFMQWWDVDSIASAATSVAEEAIDDVEISLVLDVSGSMNSYNRLTNLKVAAKNFVQEMADKTEDGKLSISIIPYATQVSLPDYLMNELGTTGSNDRANCVNFASSEFNSTAFDLSIIRQRTLHFTPWYTYDKRPSNGFVYNEVCDELDNRELTVLQKDPEILKDHIESFTAGGNTSIDLGLKWGLTLLDESFQPVIANLAGTELPAEFATRPNTYSSKDAMKVLVLMTDGANTTQYMVNDPYRTGQSILWWNAKKSTYSTFDYETDKYFWHEVDYTEWDGSKGWYWGREIWQDDPYGNEEYTVYRCTYRSGGVCYSFDYGESETRTVLDSDGEPATSVNLNWEQVWERTTRRSIRNLFREALGNTKGNNWYYNAVTSIGSSTKDPRARAMCAAARANGIVIFTIAFEAPSQGKALLKDCKSDDGAYYEASGNEIVDVFASIGSTIRNLRLTQ
ncbi:MAG: pilus assembly protein TadG-related protein [Ruegeria sp.]